MNILARHILARGRFGPSSLCRRKHLNCRKPCTD